MPQRPAKLLFCLAAAVLAGAESPSATVVVSATLAPGTLAQANREVIILDAGTLQALPVRTLADALALAPAIDVQSRVPGGLFGDLRMRGTSYAGVLVCIDGVRWNDPQTGHFNLEIPIPLDLVERIEVITGSQCAFFGSDAVGGVVNIITRNPGRIARARVEGGSYGARSASALVEGGPGPWRGRVYGGFGHSDGFTADRDSTLVQAGAEGQRDLPGGRARALYTYQDSRFGAQGFYGDYPSWEATTVHGLLLSAQLDKGAFAGHATSVDLAWRRHDDNFLLYRDAPARYQNLHTDNTWQIKAVSALVRGRSTTITADLEAARDSLASARLGNHEVNRLSAALEVLQDLGPGLTLQASLRGDHTSTWGQVLTPGAGLTWLASPGLKLRAAWGRAFRAPSFTELYYLSPAQVGNAALRPEKAASVEAGADWYGPGGTILSLTGYQRRDRDQIDWVRTVATAPWVAANLGEVRVRGLSASAGFQPASWLRCSAGWTRTLQALPAVAYTSRYAPDSVRSQVGLAAEAQLGPATRCSGTYAWKRLAQGGPDPSLLALKLSRRWGAFEAQVRGENLLGRRSEEIPGVAVPGRTFSLGVAWSQPARP